MKKGIAILLMSMLVILSSTTVFAAGKGNGDQIRDQLQLRDGTCVETCNYVNCGDCVQDRVQDKDMLKTQDKLMTQDRIMTQDMLKIKEMLNEQDWSKLHEWLKTRSREQLLDLLITLDQSKLQDQTKDQLLEQIKEHIYLHDGSC